MSDSGALPKFKPLSSSNHTTWSGEMRAWLMRGGYWMLIKGEELKPGSLVEGKPTTDESSATLAWSIKAGKAAAELYLALEPEQRTHVVGLEDDPVAIWKKLEAVHLQKRPGSRFLSYDHFFSIQKKEDETLTSLMTRIDEAMIQVKNLRPDKFSLDDLDQELVCMAMIRAFPAEYDSFASSLQLMDKLEKSKLQESFIGGDLRRQCSVLSPPLQVASIASHTSPNSSVSCDFCSLPGHSIATCYRFKAGKAEATKEALEKCQQRKGKGRAQKANVASTSTTQATTTTTTPDPSTVQELAGNASTALSGPPTSSSVYPDAHDYWTADTGITSHMTSHGHWLRNYTPFRPPIRLADNSVVFSEGVGSVVFCPEVEGRSLRPVEFTRVLYVPRLRNNLLSVLYLLLNHRIQIHIYKPRMDFSRDKTLLFCAPVDSTHTAYLSGHVAIPSLTPAQSAHLSSASTLPQDLSLWHRHLAHHHYQGVKTLISKGLATGIKLDSAAAPDPICEPCLSGKMHAHPFPTTNTVTPRLLGLIHSDLHGPLRCQTHSGFRYWITFIDDRSKFKAAIPLKAKSEAFLAFKRYRAYAMTKHNLEIGALQDDKGGEYMSKEFDSFCADHGIVRRHTVRNRPQQNGVAERFNRLLNESITTMLAESNLPMQFWGEALATFIHIHNRCSTSSLPNTTPFEMWEGSKPDLSHLRVWGCTAYVHVQKDKRSSSLGSHMEKCVFIGYPPGYKGWKFYNPTTRKSVISERAEFDERYYPGLKQFSTPSSLLLLEPSTPATATSHSPSFVDFGIPPDEEQVVPAAHPGGEEPIAGQPEPAGLQPDPPAALPASPPVPPAPVPIAEPEEFVLPPALQPPCPVQPRRTNSLIPPSPYPPPTGKRVRKPVHHGLPPPLAPVPPRRSTPSPALSPSPAPPSPSPAPPQPGPSQPTRHSTRTNLGVPPGEWWKVRETSPIPEDDESDDSDAHEDQDQESTYEDADTHLSEAAQAVSASDPKSYTEALKRPDAPKWIEATQKEFDGLIANGTWEYCQLPPGAKAIGCRWVLNIKHLADGTIDRYKARLVAQGFSQRPGFDHVETFAPTVRMATIRVILALAALEDLELYSIDISQAFLNGDLDVD
ncbi:hypothetical protein NLI96_g1948 [Meripilus lineatus]|uniref:Integrase catalytic domain-containing protein n=1 Tax=Meripilus lineatus TaxID=2056292 RepID=A0AAD5YME0_9APHY|nr:hypothetical protein NLI96_g1948 [Physisporinus lineatus]